MTEQSSIVTIRSGASLVIVAAVLSCVPPTEALANGKVHGHTSHRGTSWHAERDFGHGWGWDASVGFYEGPFLASQGQRVLPVF